MAFNVLLTAGSRRVPLVRAFRRAISLVGGRIIVTDINPLSPAVHVADAAYEAPLSSDETYLDSIVEVCRRESIHLIVPTIDDELPLFGAAIARFERLGVKVAASPELTSRLCNDKYALCQHLRTAQIHSAASWLPDEVPPSPTFPLFIKPRNGRGSVGAYPIRTARELEFFLEYVHEPVVQEFLIGPEFTIDLLCGFDQVPRAVVPRERVVIRAGVTDRGRTVREPALIQLALDCAAALDFVGAVNIQCRMVNDVPVVFEINPRFSGGIPLTIAAGADFPKMLVELARGREVAPSIGRFQDGLWMTNYEEALYVDGERSILRPLDAEARPALLARQVA